MRLLKTFSDRSWTQPLPICAWLIEHPDGLLVVDTGETSRVSEPGYFPRWHPYFRTGLTEWVSREDEVDRRLEELGFSVADVRWVVVTHLHTDHAGGLHHFEDSEILVSRRELHAASGLMGRVRGYLNNQFPDWFAPRPIDFSPREAFGPFDEGYVLTSAADVHLVPTPGHSHGQLAVIVQEGDHVVCIAGDAAYTEQLMLEGAIDGVAPNEAKARETLKKLQVLVHEMPTVYLPSHDPDSAERLAARRTVETSDRRLVATR